MKGGEREMRRKMMWLAGWLVQGAIAATRPPHRGRLVGVAVLAAGGVLLAMMVVKVAIANAGGTTGSTTATTATDSGLPAPYNKPPSLGCTSNTLPYVLSRSRVHKFTLIVACSGLAKQASFELITLPRGWKFIGKGSDERTCTANLRGRTRCWERHAYHEVDGKPTWYESNLTPWRYGKRANWIIKMNMFLTSKVRLGRMHNCLTLTGNAQNGQLQLSPDQEDESGCYPVVK